MGIDFNDAEGIEPELLEQAQKGEAMMKETVATDGESLKISGGGGGGGGGGGQLPFDEVLRQSQDKITEVKKIIAMGGFTGPDKCKYETSLAHAEWIHSRNLEKKCNNDIKEKSVKYTALVNGKAQTHEINKAHKEWKDIRDNCKKSSSDLFEKANKYIETDRRCRLDKAADNDIYPSLLTDANKGENKAGFEVRREVNTEKVEGFVGTSGGIMEGFDFYNGANYDDTNKISVPASGSTPAIMKYNVRLPRYADTKRDTTVQPSNTILPWSEYFINCEAITDTAQRALCVTAQKASTDTTHISIDNFNSTINALFDKADRLLNLYYNVNLKSTYSPDASVLSASATNAILENQKKNIALYKQNALYDYDEYNNLAFYEDLVMFLYYAVFAIFVIMSLREFFSSGGGAYDKRNIIILILLGIYPKYILPLVLWIFNNLTNIMELLGVKNVRFWSA
jgi:hypothetical protein